MSQDQMTLEILLRELLEVKQKIQDNKMILKHYKVQSEQLTQLKNAYKELKRQIDDEKKRIEEDFMLDIDYEQAKKDEITYKEEFREKAAALREKASEMNKGEDLVQMEYNIDDQPLHLQIERIVKVYLNGSEQK